MCLIEKINTYPFDRKKWLLGGIAVLFLSCLYFCDDVKFNADMMKLNYLPRQFAETENTLNTVFQNEYKTVYFVSVANNPDNALKEYKKADETFNSLKKQGLIKEYSSAHNILIPPAEQQRRLALWNAFWTNERKENLRKNLPDIAENYGFKRHSFDTFLEAIDKKYTPVDYRNSDLSLLADWLDNTDSLTMAITLSCFSRDKEMLRAPSAVTKSCILVKTSGSVSTSGHKIQCAFINIFARAPAIPLTSLPAIGCPGR